MGRLGSAELGAEVCGVGKGPRCTKVAEAAAGPDGDTDLLFQTRTRCCFLRRKETASQEPGVESQVSPKAGRPGWGQGDNTQPEQHHGGQTQSGS